MKVLNIGCTKEYECNSPKSYFPDAEILGMDVDGTTPCDYVQDIRLPIPQRLHGVFDVVFASHVLEHVEWAKVNSAVENMKSMVRQSGEVWVFVPSLEWACKKVAKGRITPGVIGAIYGGQKDQWDLHLSGFTLEGLSSLFKHHGMTVKQAAYGAFASIVNGKREIVLQNQVIGVRQ